MSTPLQITVLKIQHRRPCRFSPTNEDLVKEIHRIKQTLINKAYSNRLVERATEYVHKT